MGKPVEYDDILSQWGGLGRYDVILVTMMGFALAFGAANNLATNYMSPHVAHRCLIPELEDALSHPIIEILAIPWHYHEAAYSSCTQYNITWSEYPINEASIDGLTWWDIPYVNMTTVECQNGWQYDDTIYKTTVVSEFELVCGRSWMIDVISPVYLAGMLVGSLFCGYIANRFGRRKTLVGNILATAACGVATAFAPNVELFIFFRFLMANFVAILTITASVLITEVLCPQLRVMMMGVYQAFYAVGVLILSGLGYVLRDFRQLQFALAVIGLPMVTYLWFLPESPRWLIWMGRKEEAVGELSDIWRRNRRYLPIELVRECTEKKVDDVADDTRQTKPNPNGGTFVDLVRHPVARKYLIIISVCWATANFTYMGVSLNMSALFGDPYLNGVLSAFLEAPFILLCGYTVQRAGRRVTLVSLLVIIIVCAVAAIPSQLLDVAPMVTTVCALISRSSSSAIFACLYVLAGELFTTSLRQGGLGLANAFSFVFSMVAPIVCGPSMTAIWSPIPNVAYGSLAVVSVLLALTLPETLGRGLPETLENMEELNQKPPVKDRKMSMGEIPECPAYGGTNKAFEADPVYHVNADHVNCRSNSVLSISSLHDIEAGTSYPHGNGSAFITNYPGSLAVVAGAYDGGYHYSDVIVHHFPVAYSNTSNDFYGDDLAEPYYITKM